MNSLNSLWKSLILQGEGMWSKMKVFLTRVKKKLLHKSMKSLNSLWESLKLLCECGL